MIPHSVLPALAHWFHLTPPVAEQLPAVELAMFVMSLPEKKDG